MKLKEILESNERVYLDNCNIPEIDTSSLTEKEKSKLVLTPQISKEYFAKKIRVDTIDEFVKSLPVQTIHKLAQSSGKRSLAYLAANKFFTALALETLRKDLKNKYHHNINEFDRDYQKRKTIGKFIEYSSRLGAASVGLIGFTHLDKFLPFEIISRGAKRDYGKKLDEFKKKENPKILLQGVTKKRKRWIKKNLERISSEVGKRDPFFDPIRPYNYSDMDLMALAALDSQVNDYNVGIWTSDKDFKKHFDLTENLFSREKSKSKLSLYLKSNGEEIYEKDVQIPDLRSINNLTRDYLEKELVKEDKTFRELLSKTNFYREINPALELFYGGMNAAIGTSGIMLVGAVGKFVGNLYSLGLLGEFIEGIYMSPASGDLDVLRGAAVFTSVALAWPFIAYQSSKKAYSHLKTAMKYPDVD